MKKAAVTIQYDEEKINALRLFLPKKNIDLEAELIAAIDKIYARHVPPEVREYIAERYGNDRPA